MNENRLWTLYFKETAIQKTLEEAYKDSSENEGQLQALSQLQYQRGRVSVLLELTTLAYIEHEEE